MKNILDSPEKNLSVDDLQKHIREDLIDFLEFDSNKEEAFSLLNKKYGSKNRELILEEIINTPSKEDEERCKTLKWSLIVLLIVSGLISIFLFYTYGAPKIGTTFNWSILVQVLISSYLIYKVVKFSRRQIFSTIQLLNIGKVMIILTNTRIAKYPEITLGYLLLLGAIHLVCLYIKRKGFDRYSALLTI